jgi:hypothetical protein
MKTRAFFLSAALVVTLGPSLPAQTAGAKRSLTQADWDQWRSISGVVLSRDGRWVAYTLVPQVGDGELVVRATEDSTEYRVPRGYLGRPNNVPGGLRPPAGGGQEGEPAGPSASPAQFSADSRFVLVMVQPSRREVEQAEAQRGLQRSPVPAQRNGLAILDLSDGKVTVIPGVRSFRLPRDHGTWVAYLAEPDSTADSSRAAGARPGGQATGPRRTYGTPLMLRTLANGIAERFNDVLTYALDDSARALAYTVVSRDPTRDGAFFRSLRSGSTLALAAGRGNYKGIVLDRSATQVAFYSDKDEFARPKPRFTLFHATIKGAGEPPGRRRPVALEATVTAVVSPAAGGLRLADHAPLSFTRAGNGLLLGLAPELPDSIPADSLVGKAVFDLWHYQDPTLQPAQRLSAARDRNRSFQAIYFPRSRKLIPLANDSIPSVDVSDDARVALATSRERYRIESMWGDGGTDVYALDPATGSLRMIREKISGQAQLSPDGKFIAFFDKGHWYSYNTASGKTVDLTGSVSGVRFDQETWDTPSTPSAWGLAGWTRGDQSLLVYDRWDIWEFDPAGAKPPVMVTDSLGRAEHLVMRLVPVGRSRRGGPAAGGGGGGGGGNPEPIDPAQPLLLRVVNEETRASGFYRDRLGQRRAPEPIVMADQAFGIPAKAEDGEQWVLTRGTFVEFPDLWTGPSLTSLTRISDANPQQKDYNWGTVELVRWTSSDGIPLKGLLFKPENFDSTKQYPMIAYFYEQLSQNLHNYVPPNGRNVINPTHYVSNGYLVFEPDIAYETGYPGPSAMKSVVPGVQALLARGFVDPRRLGIQGQSWGGYQTAYIITQTSMFAAAMAGAPVVNMTSAYGGIRWESGLARSFQYEVGQSRIGGSLWEKPMRYLENSPLFWLDKVTTPLFIMSNDADGAVPWYQGIEFFVGMRRLGKEVYLINYNNDVHNPASRANQKDIALRMQQFFDTKLKGAPAPDWMVRGIPYLAKGQDQLQRPAPAAAGNGKPQ